VHEIGIVDDIVSVINVKLKGSKAGSKIKKVNILIGELEHVTSGHFEFHFRERTKATPLEGAELNFKKVRARFRCRDCSFEFSAEEGMTGCPSCKGNINDVIAGAGIHVESLELA